MNIGYQRVSTTEQSTDRQLHNLPLDKIYTDYISGSTIDRPQLQICLQVLRAGDTLHVHAADRLARSLIDALAIVKQILDARASIIIYNPYLAFQSDETNIYATFQLQLFSAIAELERGMMHERQREGIARAKARGTKSGKPFGKQPLDMSLATKAIELCNNGNNISQIAQEMKLSRASIYKLLQGHTRTIQY